MAAKLDLLVIACVVLAGCAVGARSPDAYRDDTKKVLDTKNADIRACYDQVLKEDPSAHGTVTVKFDVETDQGAIGNVSVDATHTTAPAPVAECVTKSLPGLTIAPPDARTGAATWVYEFSAPPAPPKPGGSS
jgi:hypothetical protein